MEKVPEEARVHREAVFQKTNKQKRMKGRRENKSKQLMSSGLPHIFMTHTPPLAFKTQSGIF